MTPDRVIKSFVARPDKRVRIKGYSVTRRALYIERVPVARHLGYAILVKPAYLPLLSDLAAAANLTLFPVQTINPRAEGAGLRLYLYKQLGWMHSVNIPRSVIDTFCICFNLPNPYA